MEILRCISCKKFSLSNLCSCGSESKNPLPPKYSPDDLYEKYRRDAKEIIRKEEGLI